MRTLPFALLLAGCSIFETHDGTYLLTSRLTGDTCDPDNPSIGEESQSFVSMYHTGSSLVLDIGGTLLTGDKASGNDFEVSWSQGVTTSADGCDRYTSEDELTINGTFSSDLGFEGTARSSSVVQVDNCDWYEDSDCTYTYTLTAMKLDAATDRRPTGSIAWGYFSGGY